MRLEAGDARTLATLYDRHAGAMFSLAMRIVGEPGDAEAIVKGVFAAAWSEAGRRAGGYAPTAHGLLAATRLRAIDRMRAGSAFGAAAPATGDVAGDDAPDNPSPEDPATLHLPDPATSSLTDEHDPDNVPRLRSAFRELPPLERLAIELAYFEGLTLSQIAGRLEQAPDAANERIRAGLRRLAGSVGETRMGEPRHDTPPTRELAALYALGALSARERTAFDSHLEVHRESVREVLSLLPATRGLAWTVPPHEPPTGLRERVMVTVTGAPLPGAAEQETDEPSPPAQAPASAEPCARDPEPADDGDVPGTAKTAGGTELEAGQSGSEPAETRDSPGPPEAGSTPVPSVNVRGSESGAAAGAPLQPVEETARPISTPPVQEPAPFMDPTIPVDEKAPPAMAAPAPSAQPRDGRRALLSLAAIGLVAAAGLGLVAARQSSLATALQENLDAANTQARIAELETAAARRAADEVRGGTGTLTANDVQTLDLAGQPAAPDARGRLFWSAGEGGLLAAIGLPPVPPGRVYQLWLIPDATPIGAALLSADAEGRAMAVFTLPEGVTERVPAALTLEPAGGAASPSGDVYLLGRP